MYTKQEIVIRSYREGKSQRTISIELQISRKTVNKYIEQYEACLLTSKGNQAACSSYLSDPPVYKPTKRQKLKLTREVQSIIDKFLEDNESKKQQGMRKQILKKCDIMDQLHTRGIDIGYTTVCNYISAKLSVVPQKEAYIRQQYLPGDVCEFDWGEIKLFINNKQVRFQLAIFTSAYSNYRFAVLYQRQDTLSFMEAHVYFFDYTSGVYKQMVYDNMRVAVARFIGRSEKEPTGALLRLRGHYQFSHRFCNAYRGNEKGHVERSVEFIRRKAFGSRDHFSSQEEAQDYLISTLEKLNSTKQTLTGKTANEMFMEEKKVLAPSPTKLICNEQVQLRSDKYSTISYKTNRYSVPDNLVGHFFEVNVRSQELEVFHDGHKVATHTRNYGKHQWTISIEHYLDTFKKKPGALPGSLALASRAYLRELYLKYFESDPRGFIELLDFCYKQQLGEENLEGAVHKLLGTGVGEITVEKLRVLLGNKTGLTKLPVNSQTIQYSKSQLLKISALIN